MNRFFQILIIIVGLISSAQAQESDMKVKLYKTWVRINTEENKISGFLYQAKDSGIVLSFSSKKEDYSSSSLEKKYYSYNVISKIETRKKGKVTKGTVYGLLTGLLVGGVSGFIYGASGSGGYEVAGAAIFGGGGMLIGSIVGTFIGLGKKIYKVDTNYNQYQQTLPELDKQAVLKQ